MPHFYTARILFLKPTSVHKGGGNMYTLYMLEARGALRRHKTTKSNEMIGMSTRTAIATKLLFVLMFW